MSHDWVLFVKMYSKPTHIDFPHSLSASSPVLCPLLPPGLAFYKYFFDFELTFCRSCRDAFLLPSEGRNAKALLSFPPCFFRDNYSVLGFCLLARCSVVMLRCYRFPLSLELWRRSEAGAGRAFPCLHLPSVLWASPSLAFLCLLMCQIFVSIHKTSWAFDWLHWI